MFAPVGVFEQAANEAMAANAASMPTKRELKKALRFSMESCASAALLPRTPSLPAKHS
jgi:hypothetical protein